MAAAINRNDALIDQAERNIDRFTKLAEEGSAEQLQIEEDRLSELIKQREDFANKARAIAQIEVAAAKGVAIAEAIKGAISAITKNPILGIAYVASAIASTLALIAGIKNAQSSIPAFKEGTERVKGSGSKTKQGMLAYVHENERIIPEKESIKIPSSVKNTQIAELVNRGLRFKELNDLLKEKNTPVTVFHVHDLVRSANESKQYNSSSDIREQNKLLKEQNKILKSIEGKETQTKVYLKGQEIKQSNSEKRRQKLIAR